MVSEIKGSIPSQITGVERNKPQVDASDKTAAVSPTKVSGETVTLTDFASRVEELTKSVENLPVSDAEKVARLRDEIASGSYQVDADAVAEKFQSFERILDASAARSGQS